MYYDLPDKITLTISKQVSDVLENDMRMFGFCQTKPNVSGFLNTLFANFFEQFQAEQDQRLNAMNDILEKYQIKPVSKRGELIHDLSALLYSQPVSLKKTESKTIAYRPSKKSHADDVIRAIEQTELSKLNTTLSGYLRLMCNAYAEKRRVEREQIIFLSQYQKLRRAISQKKFVTIFGTNGKVYENEIPYSIEPSKDETANYLLTKTASGAISTIHLYNIKDVRIINPKTIGQEYTFSQTDLDAFHSMITHGVQYRFQTTNITVQFTEEGASMFQSIKHNRPVPVREEDLITEFDCSEEQAFQYFRRFGKDAVVIAPVTLNERLKEFYKNAIEAYEE